MKKFHEISVGAKFKLFPNGITYTKFDYFWYYGASLSHQLFAYAETMVIPV